MTLPSPSLTTRLLGASALVLSAGLASADQIFADDVIINGGSLCVGFQCVNGEVFGFDTIKLRENNVRILFHDTSSAASFPTTDWRITANESSNGGAEYFRISDVTNSRNIFTLLAKAPSNSLLVDSQGDVGLGEGSPAKDLHIARGDTPTIRFEQDGSGGWTPQTFDMAGNEAGFFIRDVTGGAQLPFRIRPGADSSSIDIAADNDVFIGMNAGNTATYAGDLVVGGGGTKLVDIVSTNNGATQYRMISDSGNRRFVALNGAGTVETQMVFDNSQIQLAGTTNTGANLWATIDATGITTQGPDCGTPCDAVFDPEHFEVPSIEEHAAYMWENRHLWAVGPTGPDVPYNLTEKTAGMLHELEVAHIYIEQLNQEIQQMKRVIDRLDQRDTE